MDFQNSILEGSDSVSYPCLYSYFMAMQSNISLLLSDK